MVHAILVTGVLIICLGRGLLAGFSCVPRSQSYSAEQAAVEWGNELLQGILGGIRAAQEGHPVIMTPTSNCYFDYRQSLRYSHLVVCLVCHDSEQVRLGLAMSMHCEMWKYHQSTTKSACSGPTGSHSAMHQVMCAVLVRTMLPATAFWPSVPHAGNIVTSDVPQP